MHLQKKLRNEPGTKPSIRGHEPPTTGHHTVPTQQHTDLLPPKKTHGAPAPRTGQGQSPRRTPAEKKPDEQLCTQHSATRNRPANPTLPRTSRQALSDH